MSEQSQGAFCDVSCKLPDWLREPGGQRVLIFDAALFSQTVIKFSLRLTILTIPSSIVHHVDVLNVFI